MITEVIIMGDSKEIAFLCTRLKELREKNNCTMDDLVERLAKFDSKFIGYNKSSISRLESGKTSEKTLNEFAGYYCKVFGMTDLQTEQFLRGEKIVVPDTSALLKNTQVISDLAREYSKVIIPQNVIDELVNIKNNFGQKYSAGISRRAWEAEKSIKESDKAITRKYSGSDKLANEDSKIIAIAREVSEIYHCKVDILTEDIDYSVYLKGDDSVSALHLREYLATKQGLLNMEKLLEFNDYYADSYDDIESFSKDEINAYLPDGTTLLISCVKNYSKPMNQRKAKIKWLIEHGADINKRESANKYLPALSHSIQMKDQYEMFEFLLDECGADPNAGSRNPHAIGKVRQNNEGNMPLMIAAWWGKQKYVEKLCSLENISINQQDENGFTALIKASANGYGKCRDILIDAGADTKIIDINGKNYADHWDDQLEYGPLRTRFKRDGGNKNNSRGKK